MQTAVNLLLTTRRRPDMMSSRHNSLLILAALSVAFTAPLANAGDFGRKYNSRPRPSITGHSGLPSVIPGNGSYSGSTAALRIRGNGTYLASNGLYFSGYGTYGARKNTHVVLAPKAKIIDVRAVGPNANCRYQAGVCIIRN
jgi:hypothetical protein